MTRKWQFWTLIPRLAGRERRLAIKQRLLVVRKGQAEAIISYGGELHGQVSCTAQYICTLLVLRVTALPPRPGVLDNTPRSTVDGRDTTRRC